MINEIMINFQVMINKHIPINDIYFELRDGEEYRWYYSTALKPEIMAMIEHFLRHEDGEALVHLKGDSTTGYYILKTIENVHEWLIRDDWDLIKLNFFKIDNKLNNNMKLRTISLIRSDELLTMKVNVATL